MKLERIDIVKTDYGEVTTAQFIIDRTEAEEIHDDFIIYKGEKYYFRDKHKTMI